LIVYVPPDIINAVVRACKLRASDQQYSIIVVAEGAKPIGGEISVQQTVANSPDPVRLGGIGECLKHQLEQHLQAEIRSTSLGHIQRGGAPTASDRIFATNVGRYAADLVAQSKFGQVVVQQNNQLTSVPLEQVANQTKTVSLSDITMMTAMSLGISFGHDDLSSVSDLTNKIT
jgi:6-phosphofructokinase